MPAFLQKQRPFQGSADLPTQCLAQCPRHRFQRFEDDKSKLRFIPEVQWFKQDGITFLGGQDAIRYQLAGPEAPPARFQVYPPVLVKRQNQPGPFGRYVFLPFRSLFVQRQIATFYAQAGQLARHHLCQPLHIKGGHQWFADPDGEIECTSFRLQPEVCLGPLGNFPNQCVALLQKFLYLGSVRFIGKSGGDMTLQPEKHPAPFHHGTAVCAHLAERFIQYTQKVILQWVMQSYGESFQQPFGPPGLQACSRNTGVLRHIG